jgi:arabinofuranan 3-O-arabinosyltransferase
VTDAGRHPSGQWSAWERSGIARFAPGRAAAGRGVELAEPGPRSGMGLPPGGIGTAPPRARLGALSDRAWFLIVFMVALTILGATDTGRVVFDTKLGVDINAQEFLTRLWSLWNPQEWFGSLTDQYIGYAIPMAPFFLVGQLLHIPIWLIERLWLSLLIAVGFLGLVKLARALQIGSDSSRLLAGIVFALWPTFTIALGSTSAAALPGMIAPWAVLPLVSAARGQTTTGRAAARSGIAIVAMAGVNAVSTLAVLLLPALYILSHFKSRQRIGLLVKWGLAVFAATAWWVIPLLLQGKYSFNFLPYIEQSATTARTMSAAAVLRGTGTWTAYFNLGGSAFNTAGWTIVTSSAAILATAVISATGLAGLARRDMPERRWLCLCAGVIAAICLAGYYGPFAGPLHGGVDGLLDGALAPLRSTYKFEPVLAVAIALGCAHLLERAWRLHLRIGRSGQLALSAATAPVVALALAGLALPQLTGQGLQPGSFPAVPGYWYQAAGYLARHAPRESTLVVPANPHGQFTWGDTIDDPLEPLASSPWVERGLVPYGAGSQVLLQTAEQAIESGQQVPGLAAYLARAGVRYVLVRNDDNPGISGYVQPQTVNETLALSGFRQVAAFGPQVPASPGYPNVAGEEPGFKLTYPSVQVFAADGGQQPSSPVSALPVSQTELVNGGPDSLLQLAGQGLLSSQPTVIAGQALAGQPSLWAVTDGQRRADTDFGGTENYQSYTYTATQNNPVDSPIGGAGGPPRQLLPVAAAGHQTVAVLTGAASVTASSAGTWVGESQNYAPAFAFDGNPATAWTEASPVTPVGQWIQINFDHPVDLPSRAGIELLDDTYSRSIANQLRVTTQAGSAVTDTVSTGNQQPLSLPAGTTRWLRITITGASNVIAGNPGAGISEVLIPGVRVTTYLQPAEDSAAAGSAPVAYSFSQQEPAQSGQAEQAGGGEMNRTFVTTTTQPLTAQISAVPEAGAGLESLIAKLSPATKSEFQVTATSSWGYTPEFGPDNLFEASGGKPWLAGYADPDPTLAIKWHGLRTISRIVLRPASGLGAMPTGVLVGSPAGARLVDVGLGGVVQLSPPLRTRSLYLTFDASSSAEAGNTSSGQPAQLPIGLSNVTIPALSGLSLSAPSASAPFRLACGQGPVVTVDGQNYQTSVSGTIGDLTQLQPVKLGLCTAGGTLTLAAGQQWLTTAPSSDFAVTSLSLSGPGAVAATQTAGSPPSRSLQVLTWQADNRQLRIGTGAASYVEVHENFNPGWTATLNGKTLAPATLDGWQQAFIVPAGQGGVITLTFKPAIVYHAGLIFSALLLLLLAGFALGTTWRRRRRQPEPDSGIAQESHAGAGPRPPDTASAGQDDPAWSHYHGPHWGETAGGPGSGAHGRHRAAARGPYTRLEGPPVPHLPEPAPARRLTRSEAAKGLLILLPLALLIFLAGGPIVLAVPVLAIIGIWRARYLPFIAGAAMVGAGLVAAASGHPTSLGSGPFSAAAQVLALIALAAALLPAIARPAADAGPPDERSGR